MKQQELANTLFEVAKDTKQHMILLSTDEHALAGFPYAEYQNIMESLCKIYHVLELPDTLAPHIQNLNGMTDDAHAYIHAYIGTLNHMIKEAILYRGQYCIIRRSDPVPGLASHIMTNLGQIVTALNEGYIPVIDMQFAENAFSCLNQNHMENAWELFFRQPFENQTLSDASNAEICTLKDGIPAFMPYYSMDQLTNPNLIKLWQSAMKEYMPFSDALLQVTKKAFQSLPFEGNRILGVLCRGTDYTTLRPHNHPVQPDADTVIAKAKDTMQQYDCAYCYLATEDDAILSRFRDAFGDRLLTSQNTYFNKEQKMLLSQTMADSPTQLFDKNVEYLTSLYLLGQCHCLLAGRTSGSVVALLLSEKPYAYTHFWNEGKYGVDDIQRLQSLTIASAL